MPGPGSGPRDTLRRRKRRAGSESVGEATLIFLIRHAMTPTTGTELPGRRRGLHLSEEGQVQAEALVPLFADITLSALWSSPLERARETAAPLARSKGLSVQRHKEFTEVDAGDWTGRSIKALGRSKAWTSLRGSPSRARLPGGESFVEAQARSLSGIELVMASHRGKNVAIVTHADTIKLAIAGLIGLPLDFYSRVLVDPTSVSVLRLGAGTAELCALNIRARDPSAILEF